MDQRDREKKRLVWRCRRGTRELDEILSRFVSAHYHELTSRERQQFDRLLDAQDPQLAAWLCNNSVPEDQGLASIVTRILSALDGQGV